MGQTKATCPPEMRRRDSRESERPTSGHLEELNKETLPSLALSVLMGTSLSRKSPEIPGWLSPVSRRGGIISKLFPQSLFPGLWEELGGRSQGEGWGLCTGRSKIYKTPAASRAQGSPHSRCPSHLT
jgi:hypothetical protein